MSDLFTIKRMVERTRLTAEGAAEKYWRIEAVTAGGTLFNMDVLDAQMQPAEVKKLVEAKAKQLDAIKGL